jgi:hypothetical protein
MIPLALGALLVASPALAGGTVEHSGSIVATNPERDTITISEMGPWHGPGTRPVRREIRLAPATQVAVAKRQDEPGGFKGRYVDRPLKPADLRIGDYATVTEQPEAGKLVPTKIEVVRPGPTAS